MITTYVIKLHPNNNRLAKERKKKKRKKKKIKKKKKKKKSHVDQISATFSGGDLETELSSELGTTCTQPIKHLVRSMIVIIMNPDAVTPRPWPLLYQNLCCFSNTSSILTDTCFRLESKVGGTDGAGWWGGVAGGADSNSGLKVIHTSLNKQAATIYCLA